MTEQSADLPKRKPLKIRRFRLLGITLEQTTGWNGVQGQWMAVKDSQYAVGDTVEEAIDSLGIRQKQGIPRMSPDGEGARQRPET